MTRRRGPQPDTATGLRPPDWRDKAACRDHFDPELWFPIGTAAVEQTIEAKAICGRCPVNINCLQYALDTGQDAGIWGGRTEDERRAIKRRQWRHAAEATAAAPARAIEEPHLPANSIGSLVLEFHRAFGLARKPLPDIHVAADLGHLRVELLKEEFDEYVEARERGDLVKIADALADVVYVAFGTAITYGIDLDAVIAEVHRSNMTKLDQDGKPIFREDGKVLKSARYTPPDISGLLRAQPPLFYERSDDANGGNRNPAARRKPKPSRAAQHGNERLAEINQTINRNQP